MPFEFSNFDSGSLEKHQQESLEKKQREDDTKEKLEEKISRREFLKRFSKTIGGGALFVAGPKIEKMIKFFDYEKEEESAEEELPETEEQRRIREEDVKSAREVLKYEADHIELNSQTAEKIKNYWKKKYSTDPLQNDFKRAYKEMGAWQKELEEIFIAEGVPEKYIYLAIPESHWRLEASSRAKAVGPFQFIKSTAQEYGLVINESVDERKDPLKSGKACARYLKDLYTLTNDWRLALSIYNGSFGRRYAMSAKKNNEEISYENYLAFLEKGANDIKREIKNNKALNESEKEKTFNDKMNGLVENINYPQKYDAVYELIEEGFVAEQKEPINFKTVVVSQEKKKFQNYSVKKGDTLFGISRKFKLELNEIKKDNHLSAKTRLLPNTELKIALNKPKLMTLEKLADKLGKPIEQLSSLNPAINKKMVIPDGYEIRV